MSRGLGKIQREILEMADEPGKRYSYRGMLHKIAVKRKQIMCSRYICNRLEASYSRAIKSLIRDGYLIKTNEGPRTKTLYRKSL